MIPIAKLAKLSPRHRMRKAALVLGELERELLARPEAGKPGGAIHRFASELAALLVKTEESPDAVRQAALRLGGALNPEGGVDSLRAIDGLRHALLAASGQAPADWDLINPSTGRPDSGRRRTLPGIKAYLEDLRSPFNVGSLFRTADAFGLDELILSPSTADPRHPRAERSAMGAVELVAWKRLQLGQLPDEGLPIYALELGGESIDTFVFPERGIVVLGSEELGVSRDALELCTYGIVSIPMQGAKASLNVAVAFGILMQAWTRSSRS